MTYLWLEDLRSFAFSPGVWNQVVGIGCALLAGIQADLCSYFNYYFQYFSTHLERNESCQATVHTQGAHSHFATFANLLYCICLVSLH